MEFVLTMVFPRWEPPPGVKRPPNDRPIPNRGPAGLPAGPFQTVSPVVQ